MVTTNTRTTENSDESMTDEDKNKLSSTEDRETAFTRLYQAPQPLFSDQERSGPRTNQGYVSVKRVAQGPYSEVTELVTVVLLKRTPTVTYTVTDMLTL